MGGFFYFIQYAMSGYANIPRGNQIKNQDSTHEENHFIFFIQKWHLCPDSIDRKIVIF